MAMREIIVDLFAGGGGASEGIEEALGVPVDVAVNHDDEPIVRAVLAIARGRRRGLENPPGFVVHLLAAQRFAFPERVMRDAVDATKHRRAGIAAVDRGGAAFPRGPTLAEIKEAERLGMPVFHTLGGIMDWLGRSESEK